MLTHKKIDLDCFPYIQELFLPFVDYSLKGQSIKLVQPGDKEIEILEDLLLDEIQPLFKDIPKIKMCALGGLEGQNKLRVHMDGHYPPRPDQHWALNIPIANCNKSTMYWYDDNYEIDYGIPTDDPDLVADNAQHLRPKWIGEPKVIDEWQITSPAVVRVTVPHSVTNASDRPRFLLSIRFQSELFPV